MHATEHQPLPMNRPPTRLRGLCALWLRLLLAFAVAVGGTSGAMAGLSMPAMDAMAATASAFATSHSSEVPKCHEMEHRTSGDPGVGQHSGEPGPGEKLPDCCSPSACSCACVHGIGVALPALVGVRLYVADTRPVAPLDHGHASPALPPLLEPPIA